MNNNLYSEEISHRMGILVSWITVSCLCLISVLFYFTIIKEPVQVERGAVPSEGTEEVTRLTQASFLVLETKGKFIKLKNTNSNRCFLLVITERGSSDMQNFNCEKPL